MGDGGGSGKGQEEDWGTLAPVPLKPLEMPLSKMNTLCVKKAATSCVAQMLGVVGNSSIKWGKPDAVFWGTDIPVVGTTYISTIMAKYEIQGDRICLEQIIN